DAHGATAATDACGITIAAAPSLACVAATTGEVSVPYSSSLVVTGGTAPFTFSIATGSLPPVLMLNADGTITGTPTTAGPFSFTAKVVDAKGASASTPGCGIVIAAAP